MTFWVPVASDAVTAHVLAYRSDQLVTRRFFERVDYGFEPDDCHIWTGALSSEGYGIFSIPRTDDDRRRVVRAHRIAWLWRFGAIPEGAPFLDHSLRCVGRFCLNVAHLEPVDHDENMRRMMDGPMLGRDPQRALRWAELTRRDARRATGEEGIF